MDQSPVQSTLPSADATPDDALLPYRIYGDFLSREHHAALLAWALDNQSRFAPSAVGGVAKSVQPTVRQSLFLRDLGPLEAVLRQRITEQLPQVFADFSTRPFTLQGIELELVAHNDGAFYRRHIDTVTTDRATVIGSSAGFIISGGNRKVSARDNCVCTGWAAGPGRTAISPTFPRRRTAWSHFAPGGRMK